MYTRKNIPEIDFKAKLKEIAAKGFIKATRSSDTAIGHTLETTMGLKENNVEEYDFTYKGVPVELKAQRIDSNSNITLFTFEPQKGKISDKILIEKYGYTDSEGRPALKITMKCGEMNNQGFGIEIDETKKTVNINHLKDGTIWFYTFSDIFEKLKKKMADRLLLVFAQSETRKDIEYFHYIRAQYLQNLKLDNFIELIKDKRIVIEFRMHLRENGTARNHGTAFRIDESNLKEIYESKEELTFSEAPQ